MRPYLLLPLLVLALYHIVVGYFASASLFADLNGVDLLSPPVWVGLANYRALPKDAYFKQAIHEKLIEHKQYIDQHGDDPSTQAALEASRAQVDAFIGELTDVDVKRQHHAVDISKVAVNEFHSRKAAVENRVSDQRVAIFRVKVPDMHDMSFRIQSL
jgi:hypothetical protein